MDGPGVAGWLAGLAALLAVFGAGQALAGWAAVRRFAAVPPAIPPARPPVSVLKPLHGDEPELEAALASVCALAWPGLQVVFGAQDPADPALAVVARLRRRFPACDIATVVGPAPPGRNRKVANLITMLPAAKHDVLVISDADIHAAPGYLDAVVAALARPGTGLVTTLYAGRAASGSVWGRLGATALSHGMLPGILLARAMGRQDCLGATMALRRETLAAAGGLAALAEHLADDNELGRRVQSLGLGIGLAATVPATTVAETTAAALVRHELRWARTIRALAPAAHLASVVQYPIAWAVLAVLLSGGAGWALALVLACWAIRAVAARRIDALLGLAHSGLATEAPIWLLPLRDLLSVWVWLASAVSDRVEWRGEVLHARHDHETHANAG
jgi:ceramide glucosyltransferase